VLVLLWRTLRREAIQAQGLEEVVDDATLQQAMDELLPDIDEEAGHEEGKVGDEIRGLLGTYWVDSRLDRCPFKQPPCSSST
jgi:hypothetical protein